jgi:dephospho-CoA kinase
LAEKFGSEVLAADGSLDRQTVANIVFTDPDALKALNAIVHPAVGKEMNRRMIEQRTTDHVVVLDIPLLTENPREGLQGKIVVDVPVEVQVERLVKYRGFDEADARARISRQATREQRLATADFVVDNSGDLAALQPQIEKLWQWLKSLPQLPADYEPITPTPNAGPQASTPNP